MLDQNGFFVALDDVMAGRTYLLDHPEEDSREKSRALYDKAGLGMLRREAFVATDPQLLYKPMSEKTKLQQEAWKCYRVYQLAKMGRAWELSYIEQNLSPYVYYVAEGCKAHERDRETVRLPEGVIRS